MDKNNLTRREFIKVAGISTGILASYPIIKHGINLFPEVRFGERIFRGTFDGIILSSPDQGKTWENMMNFGSHIQVVNFKIDRNLLIADLKLGHYGFQVESEDGHIWKTV
jgi:hypothetical protein